MRCIEKGVFGICLLLLLNGCFFSVVFAAERADSTYCGEINGNRVLRDDWKTANFCALAMSTALADGQTGASDFNMEIQADDVESDTGVWEDNVDDDVRKLEEELLDELDLDGVDDVLAENETTEEWSFVEIVNSLLKEENQSGKSELGKEILSYVFGDMAQCKTMFVQILLLTIAFSFLNQFVNMFENSQISRTGFYMFFLILMALLMKSYLLMEELVSQVLGQTVEVMQALIPALCATMIFASAQTSAAIFYQIAVVVIWLVERLLNYVVAPGIHIYVVLQMLNCMTAGKLISRVTRLLKTVTLWALRAMLTGVTGMNIIENMIAPSLDNLKKLSVTKTLGMIPGLGGVTEAVSNIFLGSAAVIKNAVGAAAMVVLILIALEPIVKLAVFALFYRLAGALMQPFADTRVCSCIDSVSEGAGMLLRTLVTGTLLFLITIAIIITAAR